MSEKEVVKKKESYVTTSDQLSMGFADDLTSDDVERGWFQLVHPQSKAVKDRKVAPGSIIKSTDGTVLTTEGGKPLEFLLVGGHNYWVVKDGPTHTANFVEKLAGKTENDYTYDFKRGENDEGHVYTFVRAYAAILPGEIGSSMPTVYEIPCRSSGCRDAKKFNAVLRMLRDQKPPKASWDKTFTLAVDYKSNKDNEWLGLTFGVGRDTTPEEKEVVMKAYQEFKASKNEWLNMSTDAADAEQDVEF